jgi:hypothetical protein
MKTALALSLLLFTSSTLATVAANAVTRTTDDSDSWARTLELLKATLN